MFVSIGKHAILLTGLESVVLLMMVASIIRLVRNQKLYILAPTAPCLFVFVITRFINQCIDGNTYLIYDIEYDPVSYSNSLPYTVLTIILFVSYQLCLLSMQPFLMFNRFWFMTIYFLASFVVNCIE